MEINPISQFSENENLIKKKKSKQNNGFVGFGKIYVGSCKIFKNCIFFFFSIVVFLSDLITNKFMSDSTKYCL